MVKKETLKENPRKSVKKPGKNASIPVNKAKKPSSLTTKKNKPKAKTKPEKKKTKKKTAEKQATKTKKKTANITPTP
jgi:hypothetical protein